MLYIRNNGNITFASKNKTVYNYWRTLLFEVLDSDWFLIFNDWLHQEIYLFEIPAKTFRYNQLVSRADKRQIDCIKKTSGYANGSV